MVYLDCMLDEPLIYDCDVNALSLKRAKTLVPPEFVLAYQRFVEYEGRQIPRLPRGDEPMAANLPIKLASQRGIHSPNYAGLPSRGADKRKYALSIHSEGQRYYADKDVVPRPDGTWILDYKAHRTTPGKRLTDQSTQNLMNNLEDGVPVGVMVKNQADSGYTVLGLAFVEQYNAETDSFVVHGPVNAQTDASHEFYLIKPSELTPEQEEELERLKRQISANKDDRVKRYLTTIARKRQGDFRNALIGAYQGTCPVTHANVPEALQAAHIDPYRGANSQIVNNGMLLRADIHILYDANLLSIEPETHILRLSDRLMDSSYRSLADRPISLPTGADAPDDDLLYMRFELFQSAQRKAS